MSVITTRWLSIIGIGEDGIDGLSEAARGLIRSATLVVGGTRHLALAAPLIRTDRMPWPSPLRDAFPAILARRGQPVVVLASGDPYCYGIGSTLSPLVPAAETLCHPAPSAFALACARLGWPLQDTTTLSFCGRSLETILPHLQPNARLIALSADATTPAAVAALLRRHGFGPSSLHILEALGGARERIRTMPVSEPLPDDIAPLNTLAIEIAAHPDARVISIASGLADTLFEHDGQITKQEVRAVTLGALTPRAGELLWDIGCGSGSIAIEWLLCHKANRAIAIDSRSDRAARTARNAVALGVPDLTVVTGEAPAVLADLPAPDAIFVGGGFQAPGLLDTAWSSLRSGGRLVVNAVTIETESLLFQARHTHGGQLMRLSIERLEAIGDMQGFRPARTVTQWTGIKP